MKTQAEEKVSKFYNTVGWETRDGVTEDSRRWEDQRACTEIYASKCRRRVMRYIPESGELMLDMASGPIQYPEFLEYSKNFKKRYCVDLSTQALRDAEKKIGEHGVFINQSFFDIPFDDNMFDCAVSVHTIFHMDRDRQEEAVRKLIRVTKPGRPVIIVYSNPRALKVRARTLIRKLRWWRRPKSDSERDLYFHAFPHDWWDRFRDQVEIEILPWRSFTAKEHRAFIPDNAIGGKALGFLFNLEERFPGFFVRHFRYPMIILTKKD